MESPDAVIVGAGPAGLAMAASLKRQGLDAVLLDKADKVGSVWRRHYDRLYLHTDRSHSGLPGLAMPKAYGRYPSRAQFVDYLGLYAARFNLKPIFNSAVTTIGREGEFWRIEAGTQAFRAPVAVIATGWADFPFSPSWPGMEAFRGEILHSSAYRNPRSYAGKRVLVVGFGNSGGEIALDLAEARVEVTLSVRGPVNILPRDLLGLPVLTWAIAQNRLPARIVDFINAPAIRLAIGPLESLGLKRADKGPRQMVEEDGRVPLLDVGTVAAIRAGAIKVRGGIDRITADGVVFEDQGVEPFDALLLATGFRPDLRGLLPDARGVLDAQGKPLVSGKPTAEPGLFFCGAIASATGQLREIGIEAERIAGIVKGMASSRPVTASR